MWKSMEPKAATKANSHHRDAENTEKSGAMEQKQNLNTQAQRHKEKESD